MSRYRSLQPDYELLPDTRFEIDRVIKNTRNIPIDPSNPVPEQIPSAFNVNEFINNNRSIINRYPDQHKTRSNQYKSLKYYGSGPY